MISDRGIFYHEPAKALWLPHRFTLPPQRVTVRFETAICDAAGRVVRKGQSGWNTVTDWGMDALAVNRQSSLVNYLHVGSSLGPAKRVLTGGITLSLNSVADPTNITVTAQSNFFLAGDAGNTLFIDGLGQELKIVTYTDATHVVCATRQSVWLPGISPTTGPFATAGVHFTSTNTLTAQITKFNTYDTSAPNNNAELNDSGNSRWIHQRIFLSAVVSGSAWSVNQLGWSDGNGSDLVFGKVNLAAPDAVAVGQRYRVQLQLYSAKTPTNIASFSANWGATIGTYDLSMREEAIGMDSSNTEHAFCNPYYNPAANQVQWWTSAFTLVPTKWDGDSGFANLPHSGAAGTFSTGAITTGSYTNGTHKTVRNAFIPDYLTMTAATGLAYGQFRQTLSVKCNTGTITKPIGYYAQLIFPIYWTRGITN